MTLRTLSERLNSNIKNLEEMNSFSFKSTLVLTTWSVYCFTNEQYFAGMVSLGLATIMHKLVSPSIVKKLLVVNQKLQNHEESISETFNIATKQNGHHQGSLASRKCTII